MYSLKASNEIKIEFPKVGILIISIYTRGNSRRSLVVGATRRKTPISVSALDKNPMLGHLFEGNPVDEGTKRRGLTPSCIVGKARKFHIQIDKWLVTP